MYNDNERIPLNQKQKSKTLAVITDPTGFVMLPKF